MAKGDDDGIKKEILTNGPVLSQISPFTDFLTYSGGAYHRTQDAFKYNGGHIVKILGWEVQPDGTSAWIIENTWGSTWGEEGYAHVISRGDQTLDFYAIGLATYPTSMVQYHAQQDEMTRQREMVSEQVFTVGETDGVE